MIVKLFQITFAGINYQTMQQQIYNLYGETIIKSLIVLR